MPTDRFVVRLVAADGDDPVVVRVADGKGGTRAAIPSPGLWFTRECDAFSSIAGVRRERPDVTGFVDRPSPDSPTELVRVGWDGPTHCPGCRSTMRADGRCPKCFPSRKEAA